MPLRAWITLAFLVALGVPRASFAVEPGSGPSAAEAAAPAAAPSAPPALPPRPTSTALAVAIEALSPVGGAGAFYRGRHVEGALVVAGSLIAGGLLLYGSLQDDRDATIVSAVAYGAMRAIGIAVAAPAPPSSASSLQDPAPRSGAQPPSTSRTLGLSYGLSF